MRKNLDTILLEGALDEEPDKELGYSKYDYWNKDTDNSHNGHSQKTMHTSYRDMEEKLSMYAKGMTTGLPFRPVSNILKRSAGRSITQMRLKILTAS